MMHTVLITDDNELIRETLQKALVSDGYRVLLAKDGRECLEAARLGDIDLILLDMRLPDINGIEVLQSLRQDQTDSIVLMMTAYGDVESTKKALDLGAFDFIRKPVTPKALVSIIKMAMEIRSLRQDIRQTIYRNKERYGYHNIIGRSVAIQKVLEMTTRAANNDAATILIEGASGTGKSLIAKCLHYNSLRAYQPFVEINCASIPATLLESELFGHEAGAFTDAKKQKKGLVEVAQKGTLFLDEIGEMQPSLQAKMLQVIEGKCFRRIGGTQKIVTDIRIIAATNKDLKKAMDDQSFRQDLYYRLNVINIDVPPLKDRAEDILPLVEHFIGLYSRKFNKPVKRISDDARDALELYAWPGNVRELSNIVERIMILEDVEFVLPEHLPAAMLKGNEISEQLLPGKIVQELAGGDFNLRKMTDAFQTKAIKSVLERTRGNRTEAAKLLGISRVALYHQMRRLSLLQKEEC
ncbi:MAG: sigma-54 dependent transcriptional regulator [Syntrophales bacterium]|jgi:DNA-binding NtrC family response regulator|nr:sigma-54 dependent transcriptional regulator [Syntrophales bacterium]MCK9392201.1 sigma-54 dependent transcriptional regulator [Syntrophales bacterium]